MHMHASYNNRDQGHAYVRIYHLPSIETHRPWAIVRATRFSIDSRSHGQSTVSTNYVATLSLPLVRPSQKQFSNHAFKQEFKGFPHSP